MTPQIKSKTIDEIKDEIAIKNGFKNWKHILDTQTPDNLQYFGTIVKSRWES